jgi:hypothetical protein
MPGLRVQLRCPCVECQPELVAGLKLLKSVMPFTRQRLCQAGDARADSPAVAPNARHLTKHESRYTITWGEIRVRRACGAKRDERNIYRARLGLLRALMATFAQSIKEQAIICVVSSFQDSSFWWLCVRAAMTIHRTIRTVLLHSATRAKKRMIA